jgi:archaellum component FlaC
MFRNKFGTDFNLIHATINSGSGLNPKAEDYIKSLFDGIILESSRLKKLYLSLDTDVKVPVKVASEGVNEGVNEGVKEKKVVNKKRWGLKAISDDIKRFFNGKGKQIHSTGKKVQELKKIFTRLEMKMWNERYSSETLTDDQLREISGAIETFNKKIDSIVKPKK